MGMTGAERFLRALYGDSGDGALSFSYRADGGPLITRWFTRGQIPEMAACAAECGRKHNTWLNVNPRSSALDPFHRGESGDVCEVVGIYVDLDIKGEAHAEKQLPESEKDVLDFIAGLPHPPSFTVRSGNGIHVYWLFRQSYRIRDAAGRD